MAAHAEPGTSAPARDLSPYPTDYRSWKILAWTGSGVPVRGLLPLGDRSPATSRRSRPVRRRKRSRRTSGAAGFRC